MLVFQYLVHCNLSKEADVDGSVHLRIKGEIEIDGNFADADCFCLKISKVIHA